MNGPDWLARQSRKVCNVCGGPIRWLSDRSDLDQVPDLAEAERLLGGIECAWRCESCGEIGLFGRSSSLQRY